MSLPDISRNDQELENCLKSAGQVTHRVRRVAAQAFNTLTDLVQINYRRIALWLLESRQPLPKKSYPINRDIQGRGDDVKTCRSPESQSPQGLRPTRAHFASPLPRKHYLPAKAIRIARNRTNQQCRSPKAKDQADRPA